MPTNNTNKTALPIRHGFSTTLLLARMRSHYPPGSPPGKAPRGLQLVGKVALSTPKLLISTEVVQHHRTTQRRDPRISSLPEISLVFTRSTRSKNSRPSDHQNYFC